MAKTLDTATLDAMVLGSEENAGAWQRLIDSPQGADAWAVAVQRREETDAYAQTFRDRPWLARLLLRLRQAGRRLQQRPVYTLQVGPQSDMLAQSLGAAPADLAPPIALTWGEIRVCEVPLGQSICIQASTAHAPVAVFAVCQGEEITLPSCAWTLETGEAPVLLVACATDSGTATLDETVAKGNAMTAVVLLAAD